MNDAVTTAPIASPTAASSDHARFVAWLRDVAPYVHAHRGRTFVVGFAGGLIEAGHPVALVQDLSLLNAMGIRLLIVHGSRPQVQAQLALKGVEARFANDIRITMHARSNARKKHPARFAWTSRRRFRRVCRRLRWRIRKCV